MRRSYAVAATALALVVATGVAAAQGAESSPAPALEKQITVEVSGGASYTALDKAKWAGGEPYDWDQGGSMFDVRVFFARAGGSQLGIEGGYRYFWYYSVPYGTEYLYHDVESNRLAFVARVPATKRVSFDLGAGLYMFDGWTDPGLSAGAVFVAPLGSLTLPIHLRSDIVLDSDAMMISTGITIGLGKVFNRK